MRLVSLMTLSVLTLGTPLCATSRAAPAEAAECMVATVNPMATDAGVAAMRRGGNAVDAAVAAALMLGVVDNHNSGLGGGCLILIRRADGERIAIDGREMAPAAAHRDMFIRDGQPRTDLSQVGPLAVGTPGALAAYALALESCGTQPLADLLLPAAEVAERGFAIDRVYARRLAGAARHLAKFEGSAAVLLREDGSPHQERDILKQPDLANSYRSIAEQGIDWFYRGPFAEQVGDWMAEHGGVLTAEDFANYEAKMRQPLASRYRDYTIVGFPPPSSGGVHVAQMLNMLAEYDLAATYEREPIEAYHLILETMKLAFADRAHWLGDADYARVPTGLISEEYARSLAAKIDLSRASVVPSHGTPPGDEHFGQHTTHIAAADAAGNWVAITATVNTAFGSKVIVPGTGIPLNNEMDDFSVRPGTPNVFGLVGAEANAIEPGKRPLSSMSPTIVLDTDGEPVLTVGAAGGPRIITQVLMTIVRHLDWGLDLPAAVAAPRLHHQWRPEHASVESSLAEDQVEGLRKLGHEVETLSSSGVTQAIGRLPDGRLIGVHDPRIPGKAAGY